MKFKNLPIVLLLALWASLGFTACDDKQATASQHNFANQQAVVAKQAAATESTVVAEINNSQKHLIVFDDISDSNFTDAKRQETENAKQKFLAGIGGERFLKIILIRFGRGNLNLAHNNFEFSMPEPAERPQPDYESLGPVGKTNKMLRAEKVQEAEQQYQRLKQDYETKYQEAFKQFEEGFLNLGEALKTKADACVPAESLGKRLATEAAPGDAYKLCVIFSDGQFCEAKTAPQALPVATAIVLYADLSAEAESRYQKQIERLFPNAHTVNAVQADRALKVLQAELAQQ